MTSRTTGKPKTRMTEHGGLHTVAKAAPLVFKTGGMVMVIGVWFLLIGLAMTLGLIAVAIFIAEESPLWLRVSLVVFAAIPLAVAFLGFLLTFGGERITLDAQVRQVRVACGRWWTWKRETRFLADFHAVEIHRQSASVGAHDSGHGQPTHPVLLLSGGDEVELANVSSYRKARAIAEKAADYTGLPLHEATERETVVRAAGSLDESLAQRARRLGDNVQWPRLPPDSRIEVKHHGDMTLLDLPRPGRKLILEGALGLAFLLFVYGGLLAGTSYFFEDWLSSLGVNSRDGLWPPVVWSLPFIPIVYILLFGFVLLIARERVAVSPRVFRRVWLLPIGAWTRKIPVDQIEELLGESDAVILRTDRTTCRVGFALDKEELRWVREALRYLLVKGPL